MLGNFDKVSVPEVSVVIAKYRYNYVKCSYCELRVMSILGPATYPVVTTLRTHVNKQGVTCGGSGCVQRFR